MRWQIDRSHALVEFSTRHMGIMTVRGNFSDVDGTIDVEDGKPTAVNATIGVASLSTRDDRRDEHLRSADFFDAEKHPAIQFASTRIVARGPNRYDVTGDLTIRGQTHSVELKAEATAAIKDPWGNQKMALVLDGTINRKQWGLEWNVLLEGGGFLVGEEVPMHIEVEAAPAA